MDCTAEEAVDAHEELGDESTLDSNFEDVKWMVESCNVQGTAHFDGQKWT